jgi:hypothetical protein
MKRLTQSIGARYLICLALIFLSIKTYSQGRNSVWLLGHHYSSTSAEGRIEFTQNSYTVLSEQRTIPFKDTEGNIADENGNLLMSSNGVFIADANGDTMQNGTGLNPGWAVNNFPDGLALPFANLYLPFPSNLKKYILFHQTFDINTLNSPEVFYSIIDISVNNGLGSVITKNNIAISSSLSVGLAACKHANGRDWWVICLSKLATEIHTFLLTPDSVTYMGAQSFLAIPYPYGYAGQPSFSPDGTKFAFAGSYGISGMNYLSCVSLFDFNRCSGVFSLDTVIDFSDSYISFASAFSPNSQYLYFASSEHLYQYDTNAGGLVPYQLVATNDTFLSAPPVFYTNFYLMYLAANGKIYITSGSGVLDLHEMDYPDSAGTACNVNLHNIHLPCFNVGTVPNHPNYYLGRLVGSACDTLTSINDLTEHDFRFLIFPNPNNGNFKIMYLLPQNQKGLLEVFDITGKRVFSYVLPPWSTLQQFDLRFLHRGMYNCMVTSGGQRVSKKLVVMNGE